MAPSAEPSVASLRSTSASMSPGSNTSSCEPFLMAVNPQVAVVSIGADNRFGHPAAEILRRYAKQGILPRT